MPLGSLNYNHLYYFWVVAREGSVTRASEQLHLAQPTISGQLRTLEQSLGGKLFVRRGRRLVLSDMGQEVFRYADDMFSTAQELSAMLEGQKVDRPLRFAVGVSDALPKLATYRLLRPALDTGTPLRLVCRIDKTERLLAELSIHSLDLVLADAPMPPSLNLRLYTHPLGESGVTVFGAPKLAAMYRRGFPRSLHGAPFLLQTPNTALRRSLDEYFAGKELLPEIAAEVEDFSLLQVFGQHGMGLFAAPSVVEADVRRVYGVQVVGRLDEVRERFYAISAHRHLDHPGLVALTAAARKRLGRTSA